MYFINRYFGPYQQSLPKNTTEFTYQTSSGRQVAFYVAPWADPGRPPERLWMLFGGNGAVALNWLGFLRDAPDPRAGYLLLDYPGFGACEGVPGRTSIRESSEQALAALAGRLGTVPAAFEGRLNLLGHSLGSATALQFAPAHCVSRIVLVASFSTLLAVAKHMVGWPMCHFVPDHYDNEARLAELARQNPRPAVAIVHGARDAVVPVTMGRRLAGLHPGWIAYHEVTAADHTSLLNRDRADVLKLMAPPDEERPAPAPGAARFATNN